MQVNLLVAQIVGTLQHFMTFPFGVDASFTKSVSKERGTGNRELPTVPFTNTAGTAVTCSGGSEPMELPESKFGVIPEVTKPQCGRCRG